MPPRPLGVKLPAALTMKLCDSNKTKVVGAPDMPKPKRNHEQVQADKEKKAHAKDEATRVKAAAHERVLAVEQESAEDTPMQAPLSSDVNSAPHVQPPHHARQASRRMGMPQRKQTGAKMTSAKRQCQMILYCSTFRLTRC